MNDREFDLVNVEEDGYFPEDNVDEIASYDERNFLRDARFSFESEYS